MQNNKLTQKNYNNTNEIYQLIFPIETEKLIPADDSVRLLAQVMEELDYRKLMNAYSRKGRNSKVHPKNLFKVLVYGYMNNLYSSRAIEKACKRENMIYDSITDTYTCHNNKKLTPIGTRKKRSKSSYESIVTVYECENCNGCEYKSKCTTCLS